MVITPSTESVLVNGEAELAIVVEADVDEKTSVKKFVKALIENFVNQKMVSPAEISILAIRINGDIDLDEFIKEWKRQLLEEEPMSQAANAFIGIMQIVDAMYYPTNGEGVRFDLTE